MRAPFFASHPDVCLELALQLAIDRLEPRVAGALEPIEFAHLASEHDELLLDGRNNRFGARLTKCLYCPRSAVKEALDLSLEFGEFGLLDDIKRLLRRPVEAFGCDCCDSTCSDVSCIGASDDGTATQAQTHRPIEVGSFAIAFLCFLLDDLVAEVEAFVADAV